MAHHRPLRLVPFPIVLSFARAITATCYRADGSYVAQSTVYTPCNQNTPFSMCFRTVALSVQSPPDQGCLPNGLAVDNSGGLWREGCTDPTWTSDYCLKALISCLPDLNGNSLVTPCSGYGNSSTFCCGNNNNSCCGLPYAHTLAATLGVTSLGTGGSTAMIGSGTATTTSSTAETTSRATASNAETVTDSTAAITTALSGTPLSSNATTTINLSPTTTITNIASTGISASSGAGIGIGVGVSLAGLALLAGLAWVILRYLRRRRWLRNGVADVPNITSHETYEWGKHNPAGLTQTHEADGSSQPTELPLRSHYFSELRSGGRPAELP